MKNNKIRPFAAAFFSAALISLSMNGVSNRALAADSTAPKSRQHVEKAIQIQQQTHADRTKWEQKKSALVLRYEQLLLENQALQEENQTLSARWSHQKNVNETLLRQKKESQRVANELLPFLTNVCDRLESLIANDTPFLKDERAARLSTLLKTIKDPEVTIAEKYRKVMEALFIEAEYGSTIEVYQDKILIASTDDDHSLVNIFRLGRVSLFFLTLDENICGVFNPQENLWHRLPDEMLPSIRSAVEIGSKRRPVELLPLPIGRLAGQEDAS